MAFEGKAENGQICGRPFLAFHLALMPLAHSHLFVDSGIFEHSNFRPPHPKHLAGHRPIGHPPNFHSIRRVCQIFIISHFSRNLFYFWSPFPQLHPHYSSKMLQNCAKHDPPKINNSSIRPKVHFLHPKIGWSRPHTNCQIHSPPPQPPPQSTSSINSIPFPFQINIPHPPSKTQKRTWRMLFPAMRSKIHWAFLNVQIIICHLCKAANHQLKRPPNGQNAKNKIGIFRHTNCHRPILGLVDQG
jgi:hypothetical protein